ncbi:NAD(P)/FAD-dependent oxidoreductase [Candidatus Kaiserbacteria bacterium]|nr:NAD(P)/FAD-dependent oxidoreductase [Candidatus Kaiserbacteria bacterium]
MKNYDVVIVGAGNAGLMVASRLYQSDRSVLLIDSNPNPRTPVNHIYGTFFETVQKFNLQKFLINTYDTFVFQCPGKTIKFDWSKKPFCCLNTHEWAKGLNLDCDIQGGTKVKNARRVNGGIEIETDNGLRLFTKVAVDCSGDVKVLSKFLGIKTYKEGYVDLTYVCSDCEITKTNEVIFMTDLRYFNISGWWYPYNAHEGFLGLSNLNDLRDFTKEEMETNKSEFVKSNEPFTSYLRHSKNKFELFKIGPPTKVNEKITDDNFIAVGDAAGAGTTLCGEGFRIALEMGEKAGEAILDAFQKNDFSRKSFTSYEKFYEKRFGRFSKWGRVFTYLFVRSGSNTLVCLLFENAKKNWTEEQMYSFATNEITPSILYPLISPKVFFIGLKNLLCHYLGVPFSKA